MKAFFRFYGPLNDFLPDEQQQQYFSHTFTENASIKDMIESLGIPHPEIDVVLVHGDSVDFHYLVQDQDQITVYPPMKELVNPNFIHLHPGIPDPLKFVLDVHLGKLAHYLRMLGFDAWYANNAEDKALAEISQQEKRILLTRDTLLLKRNAVVYGYYVRSTDPMEQMREMWDQFSLEPLIQPFTRCMLCNGQLAKVPKEKIIQRLPEKVKANFEEFYLCTQCDHLYWPGTHYENMKKHIAQWAEHSTEASEWIEMI